MPIKPAESRGLCLYGASDVRALHRSSRSKPGGQRVLESSLAFIADPRHVPVGPNQHGFGRGDLPDDGELPGAVVAGVDELTRSAQGAMSNAAGLAEIDQQGLRAVQQREQSLRRPVDDRSRSGIRRPSSGCPSPRS